MSASDVATRFPPPARNAAGAPRRRLVLDEFLPYRLNVLAALTSEGVARLYSERFGISIPEWRIVATLGEFGASTAKAIGAHSHMHKTKVSRAVADLIGRGLIRRQTNKADLREAFLTLSGEGRRIYEEIVPLALGYQARLVEGLSGPEREAVENALTLLTKRSRALLAEIRGGEE